MFTKHFLALLLTILFSKLSVAQTQASKPFILGQVEELYSNSLKENRKLNIYLPEGYSRDSMTKYPVIYLLDGSANEDFIHVTGLVQYCNFSWLNILPNCIVVGISNVDRKRDFTYPTTIEQDRIDFPTTGHSADFIKFVETELIPFVDKNYHSNTSRMLIGQSLGGLLATEILIKKPSLFNKYLIVSPSMWWDNESLLKLSMPTISSETKIYLAVGKEGKIMESGTKHLFNKISKSIPSKNLHYSFLKTKNHATIFHQAVYDGFVFLGQK